MGSREGCSVLITKTPFDLIWWMIFENLLEYYRKSDGATKKKILGCIFAEKLVEWLRAQSTELSVSKTFCDFQTTRPQGKRALRFWDVPKKNEVVSIIVLRRLRAVWYPERTKVATGLVKLSSHLWLYKHELFECRINLE